MDCRPFSNQRLRCHAVYGKMGEDCLHEELTEKRCLALHHCPKQAKAYYGDGAMDPSSTSVDGSGQMSSSSSSSPTFMSQKAICASWAEAFAYAHKELEYGERVANHHKEAKEYVSTHPSLKRECRDIAFNLAQCLRSKKLF